MWYNLDNIREHLDDIYIIKLIERRNGTMKKNFFIICKGYARAEDEDGNVTLKKYYCLVNGKNFEILACYKTKDEAIEALQNA